jgi:hypothetical protein
MPTLKVAPMELVLFVLILAGCTTIPVPVMENIPTPTRGNPATIPQQPDPAATPTIEVTQSAPRVSPYIEVMVTGVRIRFLETNPVQVELVILGTLPDQCKYGYYSIENRTDQTIKVSLIGIHPADTDCPQREQSIEYELHLGADMPVAEQGFSTGDYQLTINNYHTSFSIIN